MHFETLPSRIFLQLLFLAMIASLSALFFSNLSFLFQIILSVGLLLYGLQVFAHHCRWWGNEPIACQQYERHWALWTKQHHYNVAQLLVRPVVTPWVIILRFRILVLNRVITFVIWKDSLSPEKYHHLLFQLRTL